MVSVILQPALFTPAGNKIIFQLNSDLPNITYFKVEVLEATTDKVITNMNLRVTPETPAGSFVDLSRILSSLVRWGVNNSLNVLSMPIIKASLSYKLKVTEMGIKDDGLLGEINTPFVIPNTYYTWNASMERASFRSYNMANYLVSNGLPAKFLTKKPDGGFASDDSTEQLYFIHNNEPSLIVQFKTYSKNKVQLNEYTHNITQLNTSKIFRLQVSPKALVESLVADFTNVAYYTVQLINTNGEIKSQLRTYHYKKLPCHLEPVNLIWVNSLGGVDSYTFVNPQEVINYTKNTFKKNPYDIYSGEYTDNTGDILNATEEIIDVNKNGQYTVHSRFISDAESYWFEELFGSKQVFLEMGDEALIPVIIKEESYAIQRQKYNKQSFNNIQVTYTMTDGTIPHDALGYGGLDSGRAQLEFINEQMNGDLDFDTWLTFKVNVAMTPENGKEGVGGAVAAIDDVLMFEFNKITILYGLPQNMSIRFNGAEVMSIDFFADYLGKQFRYTHFDGTTHLGVFKNDYVDFN